jgi:hypothetical protein
MLAAWFSNQFCTIHHLILNYQKTGYMLDQLQSNSFCLIMTHLMMIVLANYYTDDPHNGYLMQHQIVAAESAQWTLHHCYCQMILGWLLQFFFLHAIPLFSLLSTQSCTLFLLHSWLLYFTPQTLLQLMSNLLMDEFTQHPLRQPTLKSHKSCDRFPSFSLKGTGK